MILEVDIGVDEIRGNLFQVIISDEESGEIVGVIYGSTVDKALDRAQSIVDAFNKMASN